MTISSILEGIGFLILTVPLYFLFRAALSRAGGKMKSQLVGVILVAPIFFAISGVLNGIAYDPSDKTFLITGKLWPKLFRVKFVK